jgi:arginyl-tRNA synthetase
VRWTTPQRRAECLPRRLLLCARTLLVLESGLRLLGLRTLGRM